MAYKVTDSSRIEVFTTMLRSILSTRANITQEWTAESLQTMLEKDHGITDISLPDLAAVRDALITEGFLEEV